MAFRCSYSSFDKSAAQSVNNGFHDPTNNDVNIYDEMKQDRSSD